MDKSEKRQEQKNEQKNNVVAAILRAREKEMQQTPPAEELPSLSADEYEEMYQKILGRLKAEGLLDEDDAAEKEEKKTSEPAAVAETKASDEMEKKSEKQKKLRVQTGKTENTHGTSTKIRWFHKKAVKVAGICLIAGAAVFGLSMTSEANRLLLMQTANEVLGTGDLMKTNNGEDRDMSVGDEDKARQEITDTLNAEVPEFLYLPEGMKFETYKLVSDIGYAKIEYSYTSGYLYLTISNSSSDMSQGNIKEKQAETEEIETLNGKIDFLIRQIEENKEQYIASWEYKNVAYTLFGKIAREDLIKILENISYSM